MRLLRLLMSIFCCILLITFIGGAAALAISQDAFLDLFDKNDCPDEEPKQTKEIQVGDSIDKLYFHPGVTLPSSFFEGLTYEEKNGIGQCVLLECDSFILVAYDMANYTQDDLGNMWYLLYLEDNQGNGQYVYSSGHVSTGIDGHITPQGWATGGFINTTEGTISGFELGKVKTINHQDKWSEYISKEPLFTNNN